MSDNLDALSAETARAEAKRELETAEFGDLEAARRKRDEETPKRPPGRGPLPAAPPGWGDETAVNRENSMAMTELKRLKNMKAREG